MISESFEISLDERLSSFYHDSKEFERLSLPFSNFHLDKLNKISGFHSSFFQNIVFYNHNNFEIDIWLEFFQETKSDYIKKLKVECVEKIFVQSIVIYEAAKSLGLDFINFSKIQIDANERIRFAIDLNDNNEAELAIILKIFQENDHFKNLDEENYKEIYNNLIEKYSFFEKQFYLYRYSDFASSMLSSYPIREFSNDTNIKINIRTPNLIYKRIIKKNLHITFFSEDIFFLIIKNNNNNLPESIARGILKKNLKPTSDLISTINELKLFFDKSSYNSVILVIDNLQNKKDIEFIKYFLDSSSITNIILIIFEEKDVLDCDLELKEKSRNLMEKYLRFADLRKKKLSKEEKKILKVFLTLSMPIARSKLKQLFTSDDLKVIRSLVNKGYLTENLKSLLLKDSYHSTTLGITEDEEIGILKKYFEILDSIFVKIKYFIKTKNFQYLKKFFETSFKKIEEEIDFDVLKKIFLDDLRIISEDRELLGIFVEILIDKYELIIAKEIVSDYLDKGDIFFHLKLAHIFKMEKNWQEMIEILEMIDNRVPNELRDEFCYLKFIYNEKISGSENPDKYLKKIEKEFFINKANIQLSDRLIYCGNFSEAEILLNRIKIYFNKNRRFADELEVESQQAKLLREKGDFNKSEQLYKNIFLECEIKNYKLLSANSCVDLGNLYWSQDEYKQTEFWYKKARRIFCLQNNESGQVLVESNLVEINKIKGFWNEAEIYLKSTLKYDKEKGLLASLGVDYYNIAHLEYLRRNYSDALKFIVEAIKLFELKENLHGIIQSKFLKMKIQIFTNAKKIDLNFVEEYSKILSDDQNIVVSILKSFISKETNERMVSIFEKIERIKSKTLKFEILGHFLDKYKVLRYFDLLKTLSIELSRDTKNYFFYEYYYIYFNSYPVNNDLTEDEKETFFEMYYFFLRNKRQISPNIYQLKKFLEEKDLQYDIFKSAELVGDYRNWKIPEDFFSSFLYELNERLKVNLVKLAIFERDKRLFCFSNSREFSKITDELVSKALDSATELNLNLEDLKKNYKCREKVFYNYKNTKVILWRISEELMGVLILAFLEDKLFHSNPLERYRELFRQFASLFYRYYEHDFKLNKKLAFIIGDSPAMKRLKEQILKVSRVDFSLLITGESGSGKELVAKAVHLLSNRSEGPFVPVNSASIPENLLEAELFGYKKGAFSDAKDDRMGLIETANYGTLFLDEIADLSMSLQAKLLRALQEKEIRRLGENKIRQIDVRLISATNKDLNDLIDKNQFREDLYFRIQDLSLRVPSLRERLDDIHLLTEFFLKKYGFRLADKIELKSIVDNFKTKEWRGNVRELESSVKRLITFYPDFGGTAVQVEVRNDFSLKSARDDFERSLVINTLKENGWNKIRTAQKLQISRMSLFNLIKKYNINKF